MALAREAAEEKEKNKQKYSKRADYHLPGPINLHDFKYFLEKLHKGTSGGRKKIATALLSVCVQ